MASEFPTLDASALRDLQGQVRADQLANLAEAVAAGAQMLLTTSAWGKAHQQPGWRLLRKQARLAQGLAEGLGRAEISETVEEELTMAPILPVAAGGRFLVIPLPQEESSNV